ncbi:MAG: S4 domain-containing protein YaaA [Erysipelothrix sp.]|jgi:ribosome-associated protein|nr:S4 domain-containing protein YaaA [Erysipelothrix sp.]
MVKIKGEYITLGQLLKKEGLIAAGGETRFFIENNLIKVNNELETRRGKKLFDGDVVEINSEKFVIKNED